MFTINEALKDEQLNILERRLLNEHDTIAKGSYRNEYSAIQNFLMKNEFYYENTLQWNVIVGLKFKQEPKDSKALTWVRCSKI